MQCMVTEYCLELESMDQCMEQECGRQSMESTLTPVCPPPVVQVHRALWCQNRKHHGTALEEKLEFCCADKSLLKAVTSVKK